MELTEKNRAMMLALQSAPSSALEIISDNEISRLAETDSNPLANEIQPETNHNPLPEYNPTQTDNLSHLQGQYQQANQPFTSYQSFQPQNTLHDILDPDLVVELGDVILSKVGSIAITEITRVKVAPKHLQANAKEKDALKRAVAPVLKTITVQSANPLQALLIAIGAVYGSKMLFVAYDIKSGIDSGELKPETSAKVTSNTGAKRGRPRKN